MKKIITAFVIIIFAIILFSFRQDTDYKNNANTSGDIDFGKLTLALNSPLDLSKEKNSTKEEESIDKDWYSEAMSNIQKSEYNVSFSESLNAYQSPNRANNMRFVYHKNGFSAMLRDNKIALFDESDKMIEESEKKYENLDEWNVDFKLESVSKEVNAATENYFTKLSGSEFNTCNNEISIENDNLRIQYKNNEDGMRQDFIVKNKPEGAGQLRLNINADTELKMMAGGDALMFKDNKGDLKLKYASLKVWDANGRELRAYFEKNDQFQIQNSKSKIPNSKSKEFQIVVNDEDAVYPITIDPLSSTATWTAEINQASANFGWSVATAGDVNGDGYSEVIVGAPYYDNGQTDEGGVFVYHGSINGLSLTPNWTKEINQASALFGWSVATAGDINGDGYSDVIIGSPTYDSVQSDEGRAYVYSGSVGGLAAVHAWKYETNQTGENFGYSVACAGDLNNDGFSDVVIGSPFYDNGQTNEGRAYVFRGSMTGISFLLSPWKYESNQADAKFGFSVASAGDVNADGNSDIITGAYKYNAAFTNDGVVYVFHSTGSTYPASPTSIRAGTQTGDYFGYSVSTAGDVNGDGYSDVIIGSPLFDNGQTDEGKCFVYLGSASGIASTPVWSKESNEISGQFGISVSTAGDVNADGFADVILGGNFLDNGQTDEGRAFLYLGYSGGLNNGTALIYESNQANSQFGFSVSTAGDINGDGFSDIIIGAHEYDNPSTGEGAAFVYLGSAAGMSSAAGWSGESNQTGAEFGTSVSSAGDVNGDGYSDVIIGAPYYDNGEVNEGAAFVYHGSISGLSLTSNWIAEGNQPVAEFGTSVSSAGDVNGDGYSDVIVGSSKYDNPENDEGKVFVYHGSSTGLSVTSNWSAESNQSNAYFGNSVSTAGDVNGDGYSDVIVGANFFDNGNTNEGGAFVYHGSSSGLTLISNWSAEGNQSNSNFGWSVSTAGDVNGDGYSDVIIGAQNYDNGQSNEGGAFVYHGSGTGLSLTTNWTGESNQGSALYGWSVSSAGDVNGDGYSDIIVGAKNFDNPESNEGRAYVYQGSSTGLSATSNWTNEANIANSEFGNSVSSAGDVNGDGYSDVIIGALAFDNAQSNAGKVYIYNGSATGLSGIENWTAEGNQQDAYFGLSVSTAGDINGDGYSDVIIGSGNFDNGNVNEGAAYVYYGGSNGGLQSNVRQYKFGTSVVVSSTGNTGVNGQVRLQHYAKSPFGKGQGRIVYETKENGIPFSGSIISNSTSYNSSPPSYSNLGLTGTNISQDMTGFNSNKQYKWRARTQYKMTSFPFQKFSPWRYYSNYIPTPTGGFRPSIDKMNLGLTVLIEGFYNSASNNMIGDTLTVYLRNSSSPYGIMDSSKAFVGSTGLGTFTFNSSNGVNYYLHLKHRNSIETWSSTANPFTSNILNYDFTNASVKAFGSNQIQIDPSPVRFGIYSGDENQDGSVDVTDLIDIFNDAANFVSGYVVTDVTGDDFVDSSDLLLTFNNS
ncbi:MAG: integrin alpha, partial [bacterium]|nr:integrin alpha [bacterium]